MTLQIYLQTQVQILQLGTIDIVETKDKKKVILNLDKKSH